MNDRQRIEACIIPALVYRVVKGLEDVQETDEEKEICETIASASLQASSEPLSDLLPIRAGQIARRLGREYRAVAAVIDGSSNAQCMLAIYYLLEGLLQEERLTIYEGNYFADALQLYMKSIEKFFDEEKLDAAAQKRAVQMRKVLNANGYFK